MPFGMGFTELMLIVVIVVVVFGATKLPDLIGGLGDLQRPREQQGAPPPLLLLRRGSSRRWTPSDWLRAAAAFAAVALVLVNAILRATGRR